MATKKTDVDVDDTEDEPVAATQSADPPEATTTVITTNTKDYMGRLLVNIATAAKDYMGRPTIVGDKDYMGRNTVA